jgi:hypothetical protein
LEIPEAVSTALNEFHLAMESFGDAVAVGEDEHAQDFLLPCLQGLPEGSEQIEAAGRDAEIPPPRRIQAGGTVTTSGAMTAQAGAQDKTGTQ